MAVRDDCKHYVLRTTAGTDRIEGCKLGANERDPFACPDGCVFFEPRRLAEHGWQVKDPDPPQ